jgi:uncharacterized protein (DUF433 family)
MDADDNFDDVIGVPIRVAARVIGVPEQRLRRWDHIGLVVPRVARVVGRRRYLSYSLEDLVQGCVVRELEERDIHVRVVRRVVEAARTKTTPEPLSQLTWATDGQHVYVGYEDGSWVDGHAPGQTVIVEVIDLDEVRAEARRRVRTRPAEQHGVIETRRNVQSSRPVFAGTRTPVDAVLAYLRRDLPDERILAAFPHLTVEDIDAARQLATAS